MLSWLYRIATNVCVDMHRSPQRRARPMDLGPSSPAIGATPGEALAERTWVMPVADDRVLDPAGDPGEVAAARESIRLAFVAALQHLPPKQRSVLILCEVLNWHASEVAELLDLSVAAVNSALQRARAGLAAQRADTLDPGPDSGLDRRHTELLARYLDAFERYDIAELVGLLRDDAVLSMPPFPLWLRGPADIGHWFAHQGNGCRGSRLVPIALNGTAGFGSYRPTGPGRWEPFAVQVIEVTDGSISGYHNFLDPALFAHLGLPPELTG